MSTDVIALTAELVRLDTVGAREDNAIAIIAPLLEGAGFAVQRVPWLEGRSNLIATWNGGGPFVLSGHVDTVPHESGDWIHPPLSAHRDGDRLFGRGSSDMKGGVAAIIFAAVRAVTRNTRGFTVVLTAGEETGCGGATAVQAAALLDPRSILILGESTSNSVRFGHKGATWFEVGAHGRSSHGAEPHLGINAVEILTDAVTELRSLDRGDEHPQLGWRTTNVGTFTGGTQTNMVPDTAHMTVDVRSVPGASALPVQELLSRSGTVSTLLDLPAIWSSTDSPTSVAIIEAVASVTGREDPPAGVSYFTDAAVLDADGTRSYIIGPGDLDQPHSTNESVSITAVEQAVDVYRELIDAWSLGKLA